MYISTVNGITKSCTRLNNWTELNWTELSSKEGNYKEDSFKNIYFYFIIIIYLAAPDFICGMWIFSGGMRTLSEACKPFSDDMPTLSCGM